MDIGVSYKKVADSLRLFNINADEITRVYITHAHADHVSGLLMFMKNHSVEVFTREATKRVLLIKYPELSRFEQRIKVLNGCNEEKLEDLVVRYCRLPHHGKGADHDDTGEHIGFVFESDGHRMSFMTDLGHLTDNMKKFHSNNDVYFIEANYDLDMQNLSSRPVFLKNRIIGDHGHLSNVQTAEYLYELVDSNKTKHIFLAHLSRECNTSELAVNAVKLRLKSHPVGVKIEIHTEQLKRYFVKAT